MNVHVVSQSPIASLEATPLRGLRAIDLAGSPERRSLWRSRDPGSPSSAGLPAGGQVSQMGFWLSETSGAAVEAAPELTINFSSGSDARTLRPDAPASRIGKRWARPTRTVKIRSPNAGDGELVLTISAGGVTVATTESAWKTLQEPVLLAVCQYWRFAEIDRELDQLTELATQDLGHATLPSAASYKARGRLGETAQRVRALLVDLPHFEGPLTDALAYCSSERSAQIYESLAEKLDLDDWCELIDERAEAVEDTYEAVTEKLFEFKNFLAEAFLETIIVVILLGELCLLLWETFGP